MKKFYENPSVEFVVIEATDVITGSDGAGDIDEDGDIDLGGNVQ